MSSVLSPVLGSSTNAESPSSSSRNSTKNTPPPPRRSDSSDSPPPPSDSLDPSPPPSDSSPPPPKSDTTVPEAPPPSDSEPPPAPPPSSPPPLDLPTSPPPSDPPPPPNEPPPVENPPPPNAPPPEENPPPPPKSPPPKHSHSPPPPDHEASPPSPPADPPSPPPPPVDESPPSSEATPPSYSPPPPDVVQAPPPSDIIPHNTTAPPPNIPSSYAPPTIPPPAPGRNTSTPNNLAPPPAPSVLTEKPPSPNNSTASPSDAGGIQGGSVVAVAFVGFLTLSLVVFAVCFMQRRKKKRNKLNLGYMRPSPFSSSQNSDSLFSRNQQSPLNSANHSPYHSTQLSGSASTNSFAYSGESGGLGSSRSWFTYEELAASTSGFSESSILGEGGFGYVYKGNLGDGKVVAVKQLKSGGGQGEREFRAEVEIISRIHHRHLVSLVGYCIADVQRLLVYDYVPNDTLYHHLHGKGPVMSWANRFKCGIGAARGLAYLHEDCNPKIIHRDIKSANILLENNFEAKVADFGLARLALELDVHTHVSTRVMGTFGYMAPEYATTGKLTEKSDVFSYGVVLLEMITGRKPVDSTRPVFDEGLVEWARPLLAQAIESENFDGIVDHRLENNFVKIEMFRLIEAAAACVRHFASKRPKMSQVARALESIEEISDLTNGLKPGESQIYDPRQQSTQMRMFEKMAFGSQEYSSDFNNSRSSWTSGL